MRIPRWLDYLILAFGVFTMATVAAVFTAPLRLHDLLTRRGRDHRRDLEHRRPGGDRRPLWDGTKEWR